MTTSSSGQPPTVDHYFSAQPASATQLRQVSVELAGSVRAVSVASGVFSSAGIDRGTAVLLRTVAAPRHTGVFLDLGCGWGPLALTLALASPEATVWAVDVNERALDLARRNASDLGVAVHAVRPEEVPADLRFDVIWSNPPIRIGKAALHDLLRAWLPRLTPDGVAHLVVAKDLGADSLARWLAQELGASELGASEVGGSELGAEYGVARVATDKGFRVLSVTRRASADAGRER